MMLMCTLTQLCNNSLLHALALTESCAYVQASFGKDLFSDKTLTQMARLVRDKEINVLKKVRRS